MNGYSVDTVSAGINKWLSGSAIGQSIFYITQDQEGGKRKRSTKISK